ncbi:MAG: 7-carboxy-7-deazaguanine synthase [Deltaproteobacteria bacterium GWA2_38_16]|nr:MAG: 7-carboxy-7-deazaguanine synthase [Deltaproteobacteria bacterium GWA2_38_16]OGQ01756.1 MAG: 7-carboxy-7-deazaguanine synthase [Deltaproteobacteria bacterium RIFCSPHIGHO2_02_FULL_38_15]OGQ33437.1 MAG: 7-carboxy-7-deazaguanine synthase [Deltaproteobacteria bacterium RIFCSPLOWO2_01_FULL_38_9]OGQ59429.1 MAG: 7-carboxy-7-deazaguanine synthase [Deltaproteobacteria bacterium RIFCSPLOWO2_12_FULL_38_8]HBQ21441.1 7-carboxy-7-deazaguanine synthase [Deltaproteobacteria bacterium]
MLTVNEIFYSIQGESTRSGEPCIFIRLTACNLRCTYCDTAYAFYDGKKMSIQEILKEIQKFNCKTVEVTGGEPLLQEEVYPLMDILVDNFYAVLLETSGSILINKVNSKVIKIIDFKTPSSHMAHHNLWENLNHLNTQDEIKFVVGDRSDYEWSKSVITQYGLATRCHKVLLSAIHKELSPGILGEWIRKDSLPVKLQVQLHKYLNMP